MAHNDRFSRDPLTCLASCDATMAEHKEKEALLLQHPNHRAALNETLLAHRSAGAYHPPSSVTEARDQMQQITREQQNTGHHWHRDSIVSTKILLPAFDLRQPHITMPLTPPQTPKKLRQDMQAPETSPSGPGRGSPQASTCFNFRQPPLPAMQARSRPRFVHSLVKTWDGSYVRTVEWKRPQSPSARTPVQRRNGSGNSHMERPEYLHPHFGDPCTHESLEHRLGCGHRVWTMEPQPCASNCYVRDPPDFAQPRDLDAPYMCMACIVVHLQATYDSRLTELAAELEIEAARRNIGHDWVVWKIALVAPGWRDEDLEEMKEKARRGRVCQSIWIDPDWRHLVDIVTHERQKNESSSTRASLTPLPSIPVVQRPSATYRRPSLEHDPPSPASSETTTTSSRTSQLRGSVQRLFVGRENKETLAANPAVT